MRLKSYRVSALLGIVILVNLLVRDEYGFVNKFACSRETYFSFREKYRSSKETMERVWKRFVTVKTPHSNTPPPSISRVPSKMLAAEFIFEPFCPAVKKAIRGGIPSHLRPAAWFYYSGGEELRSKYPNPSATYESFLMQPKPAAFFMLTDKLKMDFRDILPTNQLIRKDYFSASNSMINDVPDIGRVRILNDRSDSPENIPRSRRNTIATLDNEPQSLTTTPTTTPFLSRLYNILVAFFIFRPKVEYCRAICTIAATLLLVIQDEERTFWTLSALFANYASTEDLTHNESAIVFEDFRQSNTSLTSVTTSKSSVSSSGEPKPKSGFKFFPPTMYKDTSTCGYANRDGFASILAKKKPALAAELKKLDIPVSLIATNWFQCLFIDVLPTEASMRVMDAFIGEGFKVLYRVAFALFFLNEAELMAKLRPHRESLTNAGFFANLFGLVPSPTLTPTEKVPPSVILNFIKFMPKKQVDADTLLKCAFEEIGSLSMSSILSECKTAAEKERPLQSIRRFSQTAETRLTMETIRRVSTSTNF